MKYRIFTIIIISFLFVSHSSGSLEDGLRGYWNFDSGSGSNLIDSAGDNNGDINGASWTSAKYDKGLYFDGNNDYVKLSDWGVFDGSTSVSVSTWVNPNSLAYSDDGHFSNHAQLVGKQGSNSDDNYELALLDTGEVGVYVDNGNNVQITGGSVNTGNWYHVTSTYGDGRLELYVNGDKVASTSASGSLVANSHPVEFGGDSGGNYGGGNYFWYDGKMDETRIYDRELSSSEVQELYNYQASICDKRGSNEECILDSEKDVSGQEENINNVFISEQSALMETTSGQAKISISNSSRISGLWIGNFELTAEKIVLTSGAKFRPDERITLNNKK